MRKTERSFEPFPITENWSSLSFISDILSDMSSVTRNHVQYKVANMALSRSILRGFFSKMAGASRI